MLPNKLQSFIQTVFPYYIEKPDYDLITDVHFFKKFITTQKLDHIAGTTSRYTLRNAYYKLSKPDLSLFKEYMKHMNITPAQQYRMREWRIRSLCKDLRENIYDYLVDNNQLR